MKKRNKIAVVGAAVLVMGAMSVTAFAASAYSTPAEAVAGLTGRTVESVTEERAESGKTYGTIANDAGKLTEFKEEMTEMRKTAVNEKVAAGSMTQEQADVILANMEQNQANCDGTGTGGTGGRVMGAGRGEGLASGYCGGKGGGQGRAVRGAGFGTGTCTGVCSAE